MFANLFKKRNHNQNLIFIVEDNEVYRNSLKSFIHNHFKIKEIEVFPFGELCLTELHRNPGIVIMDYFLNSEFKEAYDGLEIIKRIKAAKPQTNIIVLSTHEKTESILEAMKEYNCRYVQKGKDAFQHIDLLIKEFLSKKTTISLSN
jgi:two-component system OmpR family response regulator